MTSSDETESALPKSVTMNLWREAFTASASQLVAILTTFLLAILLTQMLPSDHVGVYYFLYAAVLLFTQISNGIGHAVRKRVSENEGKQSAYFWAGATGVVLYTLAVGALAVGLGWLIETIGISHGVLGYLSPLLISVTFLSILTRGFLEISEMYLSGLGHPGRSNWLGAALPSTLIVLFSGAVLYWSNGGVAELLSMTAASYLICALALLLIARPSLSTPPTSSAMRSILKFARWSIPNSLLNDFYHRFDTLVLGLLVGAVSVGYYDASVRMVTFGFALSWGIGAATSVNVSGRHAQGLPVAPILRDVIEAAALVTFPLVVGVSLVGETLLTGFYGAEYAFAYYYLIGLAGQQVLQGYRVTFEGFFEGMNLPRRNVRASLIAVGVNICTAIPLVLWLGGIGVVISTLIADFARLFVFKHQADSQLETFAIPRLVGVQVLAALAVFVVLYPLIGSLTPTLPMGLAIIALVFVLYFGALAVVSSKVRRVLLGILTRATSWG